MKKYVSTVEYRIIEGLPDDEVLSWVVEVSDNAYSAVGSVGEYQRQLTGKRSILTCIAFNEGAPVGFKIGYEERPHYFESWRGGVIETIRRRGIAQQLTRNQHAWCEQQGFRFITTICSNDNTAMLILNLRHGLRITGSFLDRKEHLKLIMQKHLDGKPSHPKLPRSSQVDEED
jgi:hypothetical protein